MSFATGVIFSEEIGVQSDNNGTALKTWVSQENRIVRSSAVVVVAFVYRKTLRDPHPDSRRR